MLEVGRVCVKLAGRDAGKQCVVVETLDAHFVMVDGQTRRRKVNTAHLIPLDKTLKIASGADHDAVAKAFETLGVKARTSKPKKAGARPVKKRRGKKPAAKKKAASAADKAGSASEKPKKKAAKKAAKKSAPVSEKAAE